MSYDVADDDWKAIVEVLEETIRILGRNEVGPVKLSILEFSSATAMLGLGDLAKVGNQFEKFLMETVAPDWDEEAAATLNFAIGALIEKMQTQRYGPEFIAGLDEITLYLSFYEKEEPAPASPLRPESQAAPALAGMEPEIKGPDLDDDRELPPLDLPQAETESALRPFPSLDEELIEMQALRGDQEAAAGVEFTEEPPAEWVAPETKTSVDKLEQILTSPFDGPASREFPADERLKGEPIAYESPVEAASRDELYTGETGAVEGAEEVPLIPAAEQVLAVEGRPSPEPVPAAVGASTEKIEQYWELLRLDPASRVFEFLADELCSMGRWEEAVDECRRGLVFHPHRLRAQVLLGWSLWKSGQPEEAEQVLNKARKEIERNDVLYEVLAEIAEIRGDSVEAAYLRSIHQVFRSVEGQRPSLVPTIKRAPAPPMAGATDSRIIEFLSALLQRYEGKPTDILTPPALFSKQDRETLRKLLIQGPTH